MFAISVGILIMQFIIIRELREMRTKLKIMDGKKKQVSIHKKSTNIEVPVWVEEFIDRYMAASNAERTQIGGDICQK